HGLDPTRFRPRSEAELKSLFKKYPKLKNKRIILHPARIDEFKGTEYGIRAMAIVKKSFPDAILVLTGAGKQVSFFGDIDPYMKKIANLIEELKLKKHVMLADFSMDDVLMLYSASDVVINPTAGSYEKGDEAFGLVTIEGNASGKPVIVSTSGALPEIIKHGFNGFVVPKRDHIALANSIIKLLSNDELRKKMGENGRKLVEQKFTIERMVKNTIDVYKSTVK
ncbi:MAG TPA: glycosyltransferase family 1 protein, partial [Candidatus Aenigmarchaeota archaeon]|nr:glycosyltransferase family 1 protein [Candidatus Aenigmarchaeota archaeon]